MKPLLIVFISCFAYKLLANVSNFLRTRHYKELYLQSLTKNSSVDILEYKSAILQLFRTAGVEDSLISYANPTGYGMLATGTASAFQNIASNRQDVVVAIYRGFSEAHGTFKRRIFETFSPLYWVNCVVFLPKSLFCYLGIKSDSIFIKIFQLLYWLAAPALILIRQDVYQHIASLIGQL